MSEKNKAILLVNLILLILSAAFFYQGIRFSNKTLAQSIKIAEESMNITLLSIQEFSFKPYNARIKSFLKVDPAIVKAFAQRDKKLLYQLVRPKYEALKRENKYFHVMHFHLPDATTFLRVHEPEYYGDNLKDVRPIVDAVHETKKLLTGYEVGRHGPFYRIVYPVFYQGKYIGAYEFGIEAHSVLALLQQKTPHPATAFFLKERWSKIHNFPTDQLRSFGEHVLVTHDDPLFKELLPDITLEEGDKRVIAGKKEYILHSHPIFTDYQGKVIGGLAVMQDISQLVAAKNDFFFRASIFTTVLLLLSFLVLYFTFGKMIVKVVEAEKDWERTFNAVPDMISILDNQHHIVKANSAMVESIGLPLSDIISTKCYKIVHNSDAPPPYCPHVKLINDQQPHYYETFDEVREKHYSIAVSPLTDRKGDFCGSVHISRDITRQKKAEAERMVAEEKLQKAERMEAIGLMAGGVAHDLNNILSGLVTYPELLLTQLSSNDTLYEPIKTIQQSGKRAAAVVADLLTVARGVATVKKVSLLNTLIQNYISSAEFKNLISVNPQVSIRLSLEEELRNIECSPIHMEKVLMNLISNAVEAIDSTGTVLISTANQIIQSRDSTVSSLVEGEYVVLRIQDNGSGISKSDLKRIFEPFYTKKVMGRSGTGLGLAVVWNTIKDHDAFIHVDSDESGTVFSIYFSPCLGDVKEEIDDINVESLHGTGTILVVDDEEEQCEIASQMLTMLGYTVATVASGENAIAYCRANTVDLVILDMLMEPGINGLQTYRQILKICPGQKAIIASGFSENKSVKDIKSLGAGFFIKKPYSIKLLGEAVLHELG
jgi:PAS domain S-box-containing protein